MNKLAYKIGTGLATLGLLAATMAPAAMAAGTTVKIKGNGAGSKNTVLASSFTSNKTVQKNTTNAVTLTAVGINTGLNMINGSTGDPAGDPKIVTGDGTTTVDVTVSGSKNVAPATDPCNCLSDTTVTIKGNGDGSINTAFVAQSSSDLTVQKNTTNVFTGTLTITNTGGNIINDSTGGDNTIKTGTGETTVTVDVGGSTNK